MKMIIKIARMELQKMFYSPIAWLILIIFALQSGITFINIFDQFVTWSELGHHFGNLTNRIYTHPNGGLFARILNNIYLYIPLITMGMMSKEFGSGSIKLLYSSPISNKQIVLGKFLSAMVFGLAMVFVLFFISLYGFIGIDNFDFPQILSALLGLYLLICTYAAIGLFMSALTSYQVVAAMGTFAVLFVLGQIGGMWQGLEFVRDITYWLSINGRAITFITGLICSEDFLYFILVSGLFITFTVLRLRGIREKNPKYVSVMRYSGAFLIVAILGYVSTIPSLMKYHDTTHTKALTLTENSQQVLSKVKGKITITTYVNIFGQNAWFGMPRMVKVDMDRYSHYRRFRPDIKMKYKYYYELPVQEDLLRNHHQRFADMTLEEAFKKSCKTFDVDEKRFKPGKEYLGEINLKAELNRFVRKLETEDGREFILHLYDDMMRFPNESQRTAAFKALARDLPVVGFVTGHQERSVNNFGSRGYHGLAKEKPFRPSLRNNGIEFMECNLSTAVPSNVDILVIAEPRAHYTEQDMDHLNAFINKGGNLVIACDRKRQQFLNPLVERFGVKFMEGQVVEHNKGYTMDLITSAITPEGQQIAHQFATLVAREGCVTMPGAVGIDHENLVKDFKATKVMQSDWAHNRRQLDSIGSWNELKTTDFIDDTARYDRSSGEKLGPITTALALTREVNGKQQRIMILGDADCFSNAEITMNRKGIDAMNFLMCNGMFFWLTHEESPTDVRRPEPPDNNLLASDDDMPVVGFIYRIVIPVLLALTCLLIWLRRRGR